MSRRDRTVVLTERRSAVRRLPRADVDDLARHFRHVVDVTPTFDRGSYRLTARGYVGSFRTASVRWEVRPKLPWESLRLLAGVRHSPAGSATLDTGWFGGLADLLAGRLADLIRERAEAGLLHDYAERETQEASVRGRIDLPRQLRDARTPSLFHLVADEFTPDVVWHRLPKAAARRLLDHPGLGAEARARLADAAGAFEGVSDVVPSTEELNRLRFDRRSEPYRSLVAFSRLVLGQAGPPEEPGSAFLVNLEHLFQQHVVERLARPDAMRPGWSVEPQAEVVLAADGTFSPLVLRPDLLARDSRGRPASVWDVKWKSLTEAGPDAADVHQVLGYAAALGLRAAGLVYPGRRFASGTYTASGSPVTLRVVRLRLVGSPELCDRAATRLARLVAHS